MIKRWKLSLLFTAVLLFAGISVASAHVSVYPKEAVQGSYEKFAVRVPSEKSDSATVKVEVRFPLDQVTISRFEPKPGWSYETVKDDNGAITAVIWTAEEGSGLGPTEFGEFYMSGKVADEATSIQWKAYQTYADGEVVNWVGADGSDKPASVTTVKPKPAGAATDSHGHTIAQGDETEAAGQPANEAAASSGSSQAALWVAIAALVVSVLALVRSMKRAG